MKVKELMTRNVLSVTKDMSIRRLIKLMDEHSITGAPVVDAEGFLIGIVSGKDVIQAIDHLLRVQLSIDEQQELKGKYNWVEGVMSTRVITATEEDDVREVFRRMVEHKIHRMPVVRDGKPVGIISSQDACRLVSGLDELRMKA
jgi:CBS domain-containing protein